jgi:prepilin-type N-terminal cleavage/methylation domain-containing protein
VGTRGKVAGFTLVELLVAVTILGLVIGVATYGYGLFARQWSGRLGGFDDAQGEYRRVALVVRALEDTLPFVVRDDAGVPGFYFLGREEGLTLVTGSPVFTPGEQAVIRVFREPVADGRWRIVYEEAPLRGVDLRLAGQTLPFSHRLVVADGVARVAFAYYGWASADARARAGEDDVQATPSWSTEFDGLVRRQHPERIALRLGAGEAIVFVPDRADLALRRFGDFR